MRQYSESFKSKMVQRMVGRAALSANELSNKVGVQQPTLSRWLREAQGKVGRVKLCPFPHDAIPPRRHEDWSAEERLRVVMEASRLRDDELGAFLRRQGIHEATLVE